MKPFPQILIPWLVAPLLIFSCIRGGGDAPVPGDLGAGCTLKSDCRAGLFCVVDKCSSDPAPDDGATEDAGYGQASVDGWADGDAESSDGSHGEAPNEGMWTDPESGLIWENPPKDRHYGWEMAGYYCLSLTLGGRGWRLPSISELRTLIRGCGVTQSDGNCLVSEDCLFADCWSDSCEGCALMHGPGSNGYYWPAEIIYTEQAWFWSSSAYVGNSSLTWLAGFDTGSVQPLFNGDVFSVRCVRAAP